MNTEKRTKLVLENNMGQMIRSVHWSEEKISVVRRMDTGRVEICNDFTYFKNQNVEIEKIKSTSLEQVKKGPVKIGDQHVLRLSNKERERFTPSVRLNRDKKGVFQEILSKTALAHMLLLGFLLVASWSLHRFFEDEKVTVTVVPQELIKKTIVQKRPQVAPTTRPIKRKPVQRKVVSSTKKVVKKVNPKPQKKNVNQVGALALLGGTKAGTKGGKGLNLKSAGSLAGSGQGAGKASKGSRLNVFAGKGLLSQSSKDGEHLSGTNGYGTKGVAGGKAGYGTMSIAGSSSSYFHPLQEKGMVEGGLERSQIAAVINRNIGKVLFCYEKGLQSQPGIAGRVAVRFVIGGNGLVSSAGIRSSSLGSNQVEGCILSQLKGFRFPKPQGSVDVKVTYPFLLKRVSQG